MILVLLGTQNNSFHRLLEEIQKGIDQKIINEEVIVQAGKTEFKSKDMKIMQLIPKEELAKLIKKADLIITHGGVGSIHEGITHNKKVIAVPRYKKYEEHVNDHQMQIVQSFDKSGYIKGIDQVEDLIPVIKGISTFEPASFVSNTNNMIAMIEDYIEKQEEKKAKNKKEKRRNKR